MVEARHDPALPSFRSPHDADGIYLMGTDDDIDDDDIRSDYRHDFTCAGGWSNRHVFGIASDAVCACCNPGAPGIEQ